MKVDLIKNVPLFADLTADEHQALADCMRLESYQAGEQVFVEGAGSDAFFQHQAGDLFRHPVEHLRMEANGAG